MDGANAGARARLGETGFSLAESLVAMLVVVIGLVSMAQLMAVAMRMHADAREASAATQLAYAKLGELMAMNPSTAAAVQITPANTNSLTDNVPGYFDHPEIGITRRWKVEAGPVGTTRLVTVRVINLRARQYGSLIELTTIIR